MLRQISKYPLSILGGLAMIVGVVACSSDEPEVVAPGGDIGEATEVSGERNYVFNDADGLIYVQVYAEAGTSGHDHVMRATAYEATMTLDVEAPENCAIAIEFEVAKLGIDEDDMRALVGHSDTLSGFEKNSVQNNLEADDQLNERDYPTISFTATTCEISGETLKVVGDMTIRGVTKSKSIDLEFVTTTEGLYAKGDMELTHTEFGFSPYEFGNSYKNANGISLTIDTLARFSP